MKTLKLKLGDDKDYVFSTFSIRQRKGLKPIYEQMMVFQSEVRKIQFETDEKGNVLQDDDGLDKIRSLTKEDEKKMLGMEEKVIPVLIDIFRKSGSRKHGEFKVKEDEKEDEIIKEKVEDLVDIEDLKNIASFAMTGTAPYIESNEYDFTDLKVVKGSVKYVDEDEDEPTESES